MDICIICHCSCELNRFCKNCKYYVHTECFEKWYYSKKTDNKCFICKQEINIIEKNKLIQKIISEMIWWIYFIFIFSIFAVVSYTNKNIYIPNIIEAMINAHLITKYWSVIKYEFNLLFNKCSNNLIEIFTMIIYIFVIITFLKLFVYLYAISIYVNKEDEIDNYIKKKLVSIKIIF